MTETQIEIGFRFVGFGGLAGMVVAAAIRIYRHVQGQRPGARLAKLHRDWLRLREQAAGQLALETESLLPPDVADAREATSPGRRLGPFRVARSI